MSDWERTHHCEIPSHSHHVKNTRKKSIRGSFKEKKSCQLIFWTSEALDSVHSWRTSIFTSPQQSVTGTGLPHRAAALGRLGQNQGGGIHTARVVGAGDEVVGSSGAVYHWQQLQSLHLVTFGLQQLHILLEELGCHTKQTAGSAFAPLFEFGESRKVKVIMKDSPSTSRVSGCSCGWSLPNAKLSLMFIRKDKTFSSTCQGAENTLVLGEPL